MNDKVETPAATPPAQDDFASAFAEATNTTPPADDGAAGNTPPPNEGADTGADGDGEGGNPPPAASTPAPADSNAAATPPPASPPADEMATVLAGLDEKSRAAVQARLAEADLLRTQNEGLRHRALSDSNRVSALNSLVAELRRQPVAKTGQSAQNRDGPQSTEGNSAALAKLQQLRKDYPDIAGALDESIAAIREEIQGTVRGAVAPIAEDAATRAFNEQQKLLTDAHPNYVQVINSGDFQSWLTGTPANVRQLMRSPHAADAKWLLDQYSEHTRKAQAASAPPATPPPASQPPKNDRLARAVERPRRTAPAVPGGATDFDGHFQHFATARSK